MDLNYFAPPDSLLPVINKPPLVLLIRFYQSITLSYGSPISHGAIIKGSLMNCV